jgi:hypothetical protein
VPRRVLEPRRLGPADGRDIFGFRAMQSSVKGFNEGMSFYRFYNVWLDK